VVGPPHQKQPAPTTPPTRKTLTTNEGFSATGNRCYPIFSFYVAAILISINHPQLQAFNKKSVWCGIAAITHTLK